MKQTGSRVGVSFKWETPTPTPGQNPDSGNSNSACDSTPHNNNNNNNDIYTAPITDMYPSATVAFADLSIMTVICNPSP